MAISSDGKSRKVREWHKQQVYIVYKFRMLYQQKQSVADLKSLEVKEMEQKMKHLQKKIEQHMTYGEFLGLEREEMRKFNLAIAKEATKRETNLQIIIQTLTNGQK